MLFSQGFDVAGNVIVIAEENMKPALGKLLNKIPDPLNRCCDGFLGR